MNVKNKAKFVLSVFLIVSSILIVSAILFVAILFFAPSQTKADKKLDTIQSEVQELPLAMRYSTLVGEDLELNLDKVLEKTRSTLTGVRVLRAFSTEEKDTEEFTRRNSLLLGAQRKAGRISAAAA